MSVDRVEAVPLSDRIRPNSEAAPWVIEEIKQLEAAIEKYKRISIAQVGVIGRNHEATERLVAERDEARNVATILGAEVLRLREALEMLWNETTDPERCAVEISGGMYGHSISDECRAAVGACRRETKR